ncbi:hypothetical protein PMAYCL1PPCAC_01260, partial [Pristionchus mayeri]
ALCPFGGSGRDIRLLLGDQRRLLIRAAACGDTRRFQSLVQLNLLQQFPLVVPAPEDEGAEDEHEQNRHDDQHDLPPRQPSCLLRQLGRIRCYRSCDRRS